MNLTIDELERRLYIEARETERYMLLLERARQRVQEQHGGPWIMTERGPVLALTPERPE